MALVKRWLSITGRASLKVFHNGTTAPLKPPANCIFHFFSQCLEEEKKQTCTKSNSSVLPSTIRTFSWSTYPHFSTSTSQNEPCNSNAVWYRWRCFIHFVSLCVNHYYVSHNVWENMDLFRRFMSRQLKNNSVAHRWWEAEKLLHLSVLSLVLWGPWISPEAWTAMFLPLLVVLGSYTHNHLFCLYKRTKQH